LIQLAGKKMINNLKDNPKKIGVYVAHDDDFILGAGGRIVQHLKDGNDVYVVICADGRNSHKSVLGIEKDPSAREVKNKRKEEVKEAAKVLGLSEKKLHFLNLTDGGGKVCQNEEEARRQIIEITNKEKPDIIYSHFPDSHKDHRAVSKIVLEAVKKMVSRPVLYRFPIWMKELSKERSEVGVGKNPKMPANILRVNIKKELGLKRESIFKMKSQVDIRPYSNWQVQVSPILDKKFIDYFLRGEEVFIRTRIKK
jgi:LmbE family N-acetylglucosaminyl deacetylase